MKYLLPLALAILLPFNVVSAAPPAPTSIEDQADTHLAAWPLPTKSEAKALKKALAQVRKAGSPEMARIGHARLVELGPVAAPALLKALSKERDELARERFVQLLIQLTDGRHTRLLAQEFDAKSAPLRLFCLERASLFPDRGIRAAAEQAYASAQGRAGNKQEVEGELHLASLALASSGSLASLAQLHQHSLQNWGKSGQAIRAAVAPLRGAQATTLIIDECVDGNRKSTVTTLRMLGACGEPDSAKPFVAPLLDSTDNSIRIAAINALRGIIDGDPPLKRLSVFEAIERAKQWKDRL